jgi:hypothetical protein
MNTRLPANRPTVAASSANSPYAECFARFHANQARNKKNVMPPDAVAKVMANVLATPSPRLRYTVANPRPRIVGAV